MIIADPHGKGDACGDGAPVGREPSFLEGNTMHTSAALLDLHERSHRSLMALLAHCRGLSAEERHREHAGFGYATVHLQLHHLIGAQEYWIRVLAGRVEADDDPDRYATVDDLEAWRGRVDALTAGYLSGASPAELNTPREAETWGGRRRVLVPAHVFMRTLTHIYHHQGQVVAMCRLLGKPVGGLDYPLA